MAKRPSYIGLLNDIATGERERYEVFKHWAATTKDEKLKPTLDMVAIRENGAQLGIRKTPLRAWL